MIHKDETEITFVAQRDAFLMGGHYHAGEEITILLARDWDDSEGLGCGGPWGHGGYTSSLLRSLATGVPEEVIS